MGGDGFIEEVLDEEVRLCVDCGVTVTSLEGFRQSKINEPRSVRATRRSSTCFSFFPCIPPAAQPSPACSCCSSSRCIPSLRQSKEKKGRRTCVDPRPISIKLPVPVQGMPLRCHVSHPETCRDAPRRPMLSDHPPFHQQASLFQLQASLGVLVEFCGKSMTRDTPSATPSAPSLAAAMTSILLPAQRQSERLGWKRE